MLRIHSLAETKTAPPIIWKTVAGSAIGDLAAAFCYRNRALSGLTKKRLTENHGGDGGNISGLGEGLTDDDGNLDGKALANSEDELVA